MRGEIKNNHVGWICCLVLSACCSAARGQGTFIYDQQSSTESNFGEEALDVTSNQPIGQSFTPSQAAVRFIRLSVGDANISDGVGGTLLLNLRSDSLSGAILATTSPVSFANGFLGPLDFFFTSDVPLTPGTTYYFQPVMQSGGSFLTADSFRYPGGSAFLHGNTIAEDFWFQEGVVPEPSVVALLLLGGGSFIYARRKQNGSQS